MPISFPRPTTKATHSASSTIPLDRKLVSSKSLPLGLCAKAGEETEMENEESECELSLAWLRVSCSGRDLGEVEAVAVAVMVMVVVERAGHWVDDSGPSSRRKRGRN